MQATLFCVIFVLFATVTYASISLVSTSCFVQISPLMKPSIKNPISNKFTAFQPAPVGFGQKLILQRTQPLHDILGLGPAEIAIALVAALLLFGPDQLKTLSKDVGKAAAELKEIPKTFKEGMDEGMATTEVSKMKALAAEKRKRRDAKIAASKQQDDDEDDDDDDAEEEDKPAPKKKNFTPRAFEG